MILADLWQADKTGWTALEKLFVAFFLFKERTEKRTTFSIRELASIHQCSVRTVTRTLKKLKDRGVLQSESVHHDDGGVSANRYSVKPLKQFKKKSKEPNP